MIDFDPSGRPVRSRPQLRNAAKWYSIRNATSGEAEVLLYDEIGYWGTTADQFSRDFAAITAPTINLRINSPGGDVFDGVAIHNAIDRHPSNIVAHVDGLAASTASWIALAANEVRMGKGTYMMIHDPSAVGWGTASDMRDLADFLDKVKTSIAGMYADKSGKSAEDVAALMSAETWFTAQEAVDAGLADSVAGDPPAAAQNKAFDLSLFNHAPSHLRGGRRENKANPPKTVRELEDFLRDAGGLSHSEAKTAASRFAAKPDPRDEELDGGLLTVVRSSVATNIEAFRI